MPGRSLEASTGGRTADARPLEPRVRTASSAPVAEKSDPSVPADTMEKGAAAATLPGLAGYPVQIVDIIIFHKLHCVQPAGLALKSYRQLREQFVDWNEVRISAVREIQGALAADPGSLEVAVFIKDLLELIHRQHQGVSLEFLANENLNEIRRYLKQVKGMDSSTIEMVLRLRKGHPVFPLNRNLETILERMGILKEAESLNQKEKFLHDKIDATQALLLHHFLLDHSQQICSPDEGVLESTHASPPRSTARSRLGSSGKRVKGGRARARPAPGAGPSQARGAGRSRAAAGGRKLGAKRVNARAAAAKTARKVRR
ncbi:MAG TPA: hypothetical protein VMT52_00335 [Planctomycetota bacterium]|nr:hypothetical protein [Planctomycetota bacterium]